MFEIKYTLDSEVFYARTRSWAKWMHARKAQGLEVSILRIRPTK